MTNEQKANNPKYITYDKERLKQIPCKDIMEMYGYKIVYSSQNHIFYKVRNEKTASFCVNTIDNYWKDFGDGSGGDSISLVMKLSNCNFQTACELLNNH